MFGNLPHERAIREVAVEQSQRSGYQGQALGQHVEREPVLVESVDPDGSRPVIVQPDLHVHVLPLDVEVHEVLNIDDDRIAVRVDQDVVQAQFPVNDGVLGARSRLARLAALGTAHGCR